MARRHPLPPFAAHHVCESLPNSCSVAYLVVSCCSSANFSQGHQRPQTPSHAFPPPHPTNGANETKRCLSQLQLHTRPQWRSIEIDLAIGNHSTYNITPSQSAPRPTRLSSASVIAMALPHRRRTRPQVSRRPQSLGLPRRRNSTRVAGRRIRRPDHRAHGSGRDVSPSAGCQR